MPERIFKMNILLSRSTDEGANRRTALSMLTRGPSAADHPARMSPQTINGPPTLRDHSG